MTLLDTDVLVDCLRGTQPAKAWLQQNEQQGFEIPGIVAMELVMGCRDARDLSQTREFLQAFPVVWPEASDCSRAYRLLVGNRLTSGLGNPVA